MKTTIERIILRNLFEWDYIPLWEFLWEARTDAEQQMTDEEYIKSLSYVLIDFRKKGYVTINSSTLNKENYKIENDIVLENIANWDEKTDTLDYISISITKEGKEHFLNTGYQIG